MGISHARTQKLFSSEGSNFDNTFLFINLCVFIVDEGREDPNTTINESSSALQQNAIKMAFRWFAYDDLTFNPGYVAL